MLQTREICEAVFENGVAVLMARIVDSAGACIRPSQIELAVYCMRELDPCNPARSRAVRGHKAVRLDVDEVLRETLETGRLWDLDTVGYNFRHEIRPNRSGSFPKAGAQYEIRYAFLPRNHREPVIIRFHVRINRNDRR